MMHAARDAAAESESRPKVLAVTVLTSLEDGDLEMVGQSWPAKDQVLKLATLSKVGGLDGVVCSAHRQGIDRLGNGLRIDAIATDGCVEAFVADARGVALGVQWHPEFDDAVRGRLDGRRLFDAFVQASRATQRT